MVDRPFRVGDRVSFGDQCGDIPAKGLRSVRVLDAFATEHIAAPAILHRTWEQVRPSPALRPPGGD